MVVRTPFRFVALRTDFLCATLRKNPEIFSPEAGGLLRTSANCPLRNIEMGYKILEIRSPRDILKIE